MPTTPQGIAWWIAIGIINILSVFSWTMFSSRLTKIDQNQARLFALYDELIGKVSELKGAHDAIIQGGGHKQ